jgi:hypothetical protein
MSNFKSDLGLMKVIEYKNNLNKFKFIIGPLYFFQDQI